MKATKHTLTLTVEVLHIDCIPALLTEAAENIGRENTNGELVKDDGDTVKWTLVSTPVTI